MTQSVKNYTFSLPIELLTKLKDYSTEGYIPSVNAAVKEAIENYVIMIEKKSLFEQMSEAAKDPLFMEDLESVMVDFSHSDFEIYKESEKK